MPRSLIGYFGLCATILGFLGGIFVFVSVQVLQAYPFYNGVFGDEDFFLGVTYTVALEVFAVIAALGVFMWTYTRAAGTRHARLLNAMGETSLVFGALVAGVVYVETRLLWGEILPGIHVWQGLPGGGGYPWGTEQVAYNTCFIPSVVRGDCEFLNYNELLLIALACAMVGFLLSYGLPKESAVRQETIESLPFFTLLGLILSQAVVGAPIETRNPDSWNTPSMHNAQKELLPQRLPETEDKSRPYRYVRTFREVEGPKTVSEMDEDEIQTFINQILGAKGLETAIPKYTSN